MTPKILTVDDSKTIRMIVKKAFKSYDCELIEAENGQDGLALASREKPDLIILDITMPVMTGVEMLEKMQADPHLKEIPVIMLTAESGKDNVMTIVKMGVKDYMVKPFKGEQLVERVLKIFPLDAKKEQKEQKEETDISKLYFARDGDYEILTLPKKITRTVNLDIKAHLEPRLKALTESKNNKMVMDLSNVEDINISLIKLILLISQTSNKYNVAVKTVGSQALSERLKEFSETNELQVYNSIATAKEAF